MEEGAGLGGAGLLTVVLVFASVHGFVGGLVMGNSFFFFGGLFKFFGFGEVLTAN